MQNSQTVSGSVTERNQGQILGERIQRIVLASDRGVHQRELKSWIETALKLGESATYRKLRGLSHWGEDDLESIALGLGMEFDDFLSTLATEGERVVSAKVSVAGSMMPAKLILGEAITDKDVGVAAFRDHLGWHVAGPSERTGQESRLYYKVISIKLVEPTDDRPCVVFIDDETAITDTASALFERQGIKTLAYSNEAAFLRDFGSVRMDAFVVDWFLDSDPSDRNAKTTEQLIRTIRESSQSAEAPIFVVSGWVKGNNADPVADDLARVSEQYGCTPKTKPFQYRLLASEILSLLKREHGSHSTAK